MDICSSIFYCHKIVNLLSNLYFFKNTIGTILHGMKSEQLSDKFDKQFWKPLISIKHINIFDIIQINMSNFGRIMYTSIILLSGLILYFSFRYGLSNTLHVQCNISKLTIANNLNLMSLFYSYSISKQYYHIITVLIRFLLLQDLDTLNAFALLMYEKVTFVNINHLRQGTFLLGELLTLNDQTFQFYSFDIWS